VTYEQRAPRKRSKARGAGHDGILQLSAAYQVVSRKQKQERITKNAIANLWVQGRGLSRYQGIEPAPEKEKMVA
jgi:hypothetical protein